MHKVLLAGVAFALMGQGCLSFGGGKQSSPDGGLWQTVDGGKNWAQLAALPQASGVGSIAGVNVNAIEIDPTDDSAYYLATKANGLFYSLDNGSTWQRPEDALAREGNILDVEVDPRDVCTVYALKPDRILKTTDCLRTFTTAYVESRENESLTAFALDWFNPNAIWLGTSNGEVLQSIDAGGSWNTEARLQNDVMALEISNRDSRIVFVGTKSDGLFVREVTAGDFISFEDTLREFRESDNVYGFAQTSDGSKIVMNAKHGLIASTDSGATWASVPIITPPADVRIWSVALDPKNPDVMYYATDTTLHITVSGGQSWETVELPSSRAATALQVHPTNTNVLLTGFTQLDD